MKIVLMDTGNGLMLEQPGKYTKALDHALGFSTTSEAAEYREKYKLRNHNVALRFVDAQLDYSETIVRN
jgi:hypothetical protein